MFNDLFGPSSNTTDLPDMLSSTKVFKSLDFKNDLQKISQDDCDLLIPETFNYLNGVPLNFTSLPSIKKAVSKTIKEDTLNSNVVSDI